jgi:hypothetical protein
MCAFHGMNEAASANPGFIERPVKWGLDSWPKLTLCALRRTRIDTVRHLRLDWLSQAGRYSC